MTKTMIKKIGNGIERQFEIMDVLQHEISELKKTPTNSPELTKRLEELESLVKLLAKTTQETGEDMLHAA